MILKNLSRKSNSGQLFKYIFRYVLDPTKQEQSSQVPFILKHNIRSSNIEGFIKEFKENELRRIYIRKDQAVLNHVILSWAGTDKEKVTRDFLKDIFKKYVQIRGQSNLYVGTAHFDKEHTHLHLAQSVSKLNGRSSRISQKEFAEIKLALDTYQKEKYPELTHTLPEHGKSKKIHKKEPTIGRCNGRVSQKEHLLQELQTAYENAKSLEDFLQTLQSFGHELYYRSCQLTGIKLETGRKFRFKSLGFDKEKLAELDARQIYLAKELADLQAIRLRSSERGQEREVANNMIPRNVTSMMEEFDKLRTPYLRGVRGYIPAR